MMAYVLTKMTDIIEFNPRETIARKQVCKKVPMEYLQPFTQQISGFEEAPYAGGTKFRNNDTIMARITPCLENGKTAFVKGFAENEVVFGSTEYIVMRAIPGASDPVFIYYLATSPSFREVAIKSMVGSSGRQRVQQDVLENLELVLPDYETQVRVGKVLSAFDDKIELNTQINHNLEEQAKAIFKSWFVDFEPFQDGTFVDSELGQIPAGWRTGTFGEISRISSGKRPIKKSETKSADFMYPLIGASCVMGFTYDYLYDTPIIVTGRVGTHGIIQYFDEKCWPSDNTLVIQSDFLNFAYLYLQTIDFHSLNRGSTQPLITQTDIKKQLCPIAPINILADFEDKLYASRAAIQNNLSQNQKLAQLRDALLPKLMSGEIDVSEVEV